MKLTKSASEILGRASIGMLALRSGRLPLVNPAVFSFAGGSLWMTTSRYAAKTIIARRDPRAAFLVDGGDRAVLLRGALEVFDPINLSNDVRAVLEGPSFFMGMAGYALRNAPFVAGYALDLARLPREWMPYNRVILRLKLSDADIVEGAPFPPAQACAGGSCGGQPPARRRLARLRVLDRRRSAADPPGLLGGGSRAGQRRAVERPATCRHAGRAGGRIAPPLQAVDDGRRMRARNVRRVDGRRRDRRALRHRGG